MAVAPVGKTMTGENQGLMTVESEKEEWGPEAFPSFKEAAFGIRDEG